MNSKVTVIIADRSYTLVTEEDASYVEDVAQRVDQLVRAAMGQARVSALDAAMLSAVNAMDLYLKEQAVTDSLRAQLKDQLEESNQVRQELADAKREITRLKKNGKK